jgi:hypothetical protein
MAASVNPPDKAPNNAPAAAAVKLRCVSDRRPWIPSGDGDTRPVDFGETVICDASFADTLVRGGMFTPDY